MMKFNNFEINPVFFILMLIISGLITIILFVIFKINNPGIYWWLGSMFTAIGMSYK